MNQWIARASAVLLLLGAGCLRERPAPERFAGIRSALPAWHDRSASGTPASGSLERRDGQGGSVLLSWDADERGAPGEPEALIAAGLGPLATVAQAERAVSGHAALEVSAGEARTIVWRCDRSRRLFRLAVNEAASGKADAGKLAGGVGCHSHGEKAVNGDVPVADTALLGEGWQFARRQPAAAAFLRDDAVLTLFAGQHTPSPREPELAARLAPAWVLAAGLSKPQVVATARVGGPGKHQALRVTGRALLDGRPVRFTLLFWRCIARARSFAAVVFTHDGSSRAAAVTAPEAATNTASQPATAAAPQAATVTTSQPAAVTASQPAEAVAPQPAAVTAPQIAPVTTPVEPTSPPAARAAPWTPYDGALLAVRCHG